MAEPNTEELAAENGTLETGDAVPQEPLTGPTKDLKRWRQRATKARKLRKDWESDYKVKECEEFYLGKQWKGLKPGEKAINHFLATVKVTIPSLLYDQPTFLARPKPGSGSPVTSDEAKIAEGVLNSVATQDDNLRNASRLGLLQNFFRIAVLKVCYDPYLEPNPRGGEPIFQQDISGNIIYDPQTGQPQPEMDPTTGEVLTEPSEVICDEAYKFEWVDASKMLLPDEGPDMSKWSWVAEEIEVDLDDAKADDRFPAELRSRFKPSGKDPDDSRSDYSENSDDNSEDLDPCFRYVEAWDKKRKEHLIFTEQNDIHDFLLREPLPDGIEDHPYAIMPGWSPNIGPEPSPWPLPFTSPWVELQSEYNISRQQQLEGGKRSARKVLYEANTFPPSEGGQEEALKALQSSKDMEGVMVTDINRPPVPMAEVDLNPAIYKASASLMMDWRLVTGQTGQKMGAADADTATEATLINQASNLRDADLQKEVVQWLKVAGKKMLQLIKQTLTLKLWVNIRGMDDRAIENYLQSVYQLPPQLLQLFPALKDGIVQRFGDNRIQGVTREMLQGEVELSITPGSTRPRNLTVERQQLLEFLGLIAQAPQVALSRRLLEEIGAKFDFLDAATIEEVHALAMTMIQINQAQAGRQQGGANKETASGSAEASKNGNLSQASQGTEMM